MWDWIAYYGPSLLALSGILVAYQIGHGRGWSEGFECGCLEADSRHKNAIINAERAKADGMEA